MIKISQTEKSFIAGGVDDNIRMDGRSCMDYRTFHVETGVVQQTNGSARVRLGQRGTDVLVGVKVEIGEPDVDFPDRGRLEVHVECSPSASPEFEGRGAQELNSVLEMTLRNILYQSTQSEEWQSLCIVEGKQCWIVYMDCLVLDSDGNLFDALAMAMRSALYDTKIPKIQLLELEDGMTEIEVSDDPNEYSRLPVDNVPISVNLGRIGKQFVVDPCLEEELCMEARLTVAINAKGNICSIQKGGAEMGLNPSELNKMLQSARKIGLSLLNKLNQVLEKNERAREEAGGAQSIAVGFLA